MAGLTDPWLDPAWAAQVADALEAWPDPSGDRPAPATVAFTVVGGPDGDVTGTCELWAGAGADRQVGFTLPAPDVSSLITGELAPSVAFMRGRLKTTGDPGAVLEVLAATAAPGWDEVRQAVAAVTDLP